MRRDRGAFSLVEILVASSILVACMIPVIGLSQRVLSETEAGQEDLLAKHLLIDMCERYKSVALAEIRAAAANPQVLEKDDLLNPLFWRTGKSTVSHLAGDVLKLTRTIRLEENAGEQGLHRVTFVVSWTSRQHRNREVTLTRLLHDH